MPQKTKPKHPLKPAQSQWRQPGRESAMRPRPRSDRPDHPSFVFLASEDAAYMSGQVLHPNGGEIVNG